MSFLKEDTALAKLLAESDLLEELLKTAQLADPVRELAVKMAQNLRSQINLASQTPEAEVFTRDLKSFKDFIFYLFYHNVLFNGEKIVANSAPDNLKDKYAPFEGRFIYKDGIENFLNTLREHANKEDNKLMLAMVGKLIQETNEKLNTTITSFELDKTQDIPDDTELDQLPSTIDLNKGVDDLMAEKGDFKLLAKHLKSENGFAILKQHFLIKKGEEVHNLEDHSNLCSFLNYLYNRALKSGNDFYKEKVTELGQTNQCSLSSYSNPTESGNKENGFTDANYKQVKTTPIGEGGEAGNVTPTEDDVLSNLPFIEGGIDIRRMETFLEKITHFLDIGGAISQANRNTVAQLLLSFRQLKNQWISNLPKQIGGSYANGPSDFEPHDLEAQNKMINDFGHYPDVINSSLVLRAMVKNCLDVLSLIGRDGRLRNIIRSLKEQVALGNSYYQGLSTLIENAKALARAALK